MGGAFLLCLPDWMVRSLEKRPSKGAPGSSPLFLVFGRRRVFRLPSPFGTQGCLTSVIQGRVCSLSVLVLDFCFIADSPFILKGLWWASCEVGVTGGYVPRWGCRV